MPLKASQAIFGVMLAFGLLLWAVSFWNWTYGSAYMGFSMELGRGQFTFNNNGADANVGLESKGFSGISTDWLPVDGFYVSSGGQWSLTVPVWMAAAGTVGALVLALWAGRLVVQKRVALRKAIETLTSLPWAVPGTVLAIALATTFSVRAPWVGRWVLVGTLAILPLAYMIRNVPIVAGSVLAGFRQLDPAIDEAAASLGSSRLRTVVRVTVPLLRPALLAGGALAFATALGDFVTSVVLYTFDTRPISIEILSALREFDIGIAAAYGVVLMAISAAAMVVGTRR